MNKKSLISAAITAVAFVTLSTSVFAMPPIAPGGPQGNPPGQGGTPGQPVPNVPNEPQAPGQPQLPPCVECNEFFPTPTPSSTTPPNGGNPTPTPGPNDPKPNSTPGPAGGCGDKSTCDDNNRGGSAGPAGGAVLGLSATTADSLNYLTLAGILCLVLGTALVVYKKA